MKGFERRQQESMGDEMVSLDAMRCKCYEPANPIELGTTPAPRSKDSARAKGAQEGWSGPSGIRMSELRLRFIPNLHWPTPPLGTNSGTKLQVLPLPLPSLRFLILPLRYRLRASTKFPNYSQEGDNLVPDSPHWSASPVFANYYVDDDSDDDDDDDNEDRSLDLLARFVHSMFRKMSRRARKAVRSVLPLSISTKLVGFSVNGVIILAFFWVLKAFLEVVCTIGSLVFFSILLIRGVWSGVSYLQENRNYNSSNTEDKSDIWTGAQPVT